MTTKYPAQVDTTASLPTVVDGVTIINAAMINRIRDAILATEGEIGPHASGIYGNVRNRLDALEKLIVQLSPGASIVINTPLFDGDIDGNLMFQNVIGIQGRSVNSIAPDINNVYQWDGYEWFPRPGIKLSADIPQDGYILTWIHDEWVPKPNSGGGGGSVIFGNDITGDDFSQTVIGLQNNPILFQTLGSAQDGYVLTWSNSSGNWQAKGSSGSAFSPSGDLSGTSGTQTVIGLQNVSIAITSPIQSAVPVYDVVSLKYNIRQLTLDDLGPAFAINSFSGGSTVEIGATVTNPGFTASYSSIPTSSQITNTDGYDSPHVLTTPFTTATIIGAFHKIVAANVTFTLTAVGATTKTTTQAIAFQPRAFFGIAGAGATSATASGSTAVLVGTSGNLSNNGLTSSVIGTSFGPASPTNQKIYFLCAHTSTAHTFKDGSGFQFPMNVPTTFNFTNQNGAILSYDLYESTNLLSTPFTITVVS